MQLGWLHMLLSRLLMPTGEVPAEVVPPGGADADL